MMTNLYDKETAGFIDKFCSQWLSHYKKKYSELDSDESDH